MPVQVGIYFALLNYVYSSIDELLEKGKPLERAGRKATGLSSDIAEYGSRAAGQT
ncbi:hypothetical protein D1AOALGA4SA_1958 [Olavius algarvensis Delta 1 endosymbiont]|nr:hypothetical protein D1AOALGA4SA_1958 [Olavius algarvensis Delta 1 endosymbiont]